MEEETPDVTLAWRHLSVRAPRQPVPWSSWLTAPLAAYRQGRCGDKVLIDDASGSVDGGSFLAVVGASGTGKTTLLAAITKRLRGSAVRGDILLNGRAASAELMSRVCGFVPQQDVATETLTAAEHLHFMAVMRLDARLEPAARGRRVRVLLADLGLSACADTRLAHMSGGERKRLALAVQLTVSPLVLALDEPCSGLDAESSRLVLDALRREACRGRAVLCSVHQAAPDMVSLFTHILVLAAGGVVFHGPLSDAQPFLAEEGARVGWCPSTPLEVMLHQLCDPAARVDTARVCGAFRSTRLAQHLLEHPVSEEVVQRDVIRPPDLKHVSWLTEVKWLLWREAVDTKRNNSRILTQMGLFVVTAIMMSLAFMDVAPSSPAGVQSTRGLLYLIVSEVVFTHAYAVFYTFPAELPVYLRESRLYSAAAYYAARVLGTVPRALVEPVLFVSVIQCQVDLTAGGGVITYVGILGILFLTALTASAYGCMLSALIEDPGVLVAVTQPIDFITVLVAGIFNSIRSLPAYVSWARFVSVFYYCHELLSIVYWRNVPHIECSRASPDMPCLSSGADVLEELGFDTVDLSRDLLCMGALCVCLHIVGFLGILRRSRQQAAY